MDELQLQLLTDLHRPATRQGPGGEAETTQAMALAGLHRSRRLKIADTGRGTGASTILPAKEPDAEIAAVDFLPELQRASNESEGHGVAEKIATLSRSMDALLPSPPAPLRSAALCSSTMRRKLRRSVPPSGRWRW